MYCSISFFFATSCNHNFSSFFFSKSDRGCPSNTRTAACYNRNLLICHLFTSFLHYLSLEVLRLRMIDMRFTPPPFSAVIRSAVINIMNLGLMAICPSLYSRSSLQCANLCLCSLLNGTLNVKEMTAILCKPHHTCYTLYSHLILPVPQYAPFQGQKLQPGLHSLPSTYLPISCVQSIPTIIS